MHWKNDTTIFLGDIGDVNYIKKIRGYKVLIMSNHDAGAFRYQRNSHILIKEFESIEEAKNAERNHEIDKYEINMTAPFIAGYRDNKLFDEVYEGPLTIAEKLIFSHEQLT